MDQVKRIVSNNTNLHFSFHGDEWFSPTSSVSSENLSNNGESETLSQVWKRRKSGAWIWIEGDAQSSEGAIMYKTQTTSLYGEQINRKFLLKPGQNRGWKGKWTNAEEFCKFGNEKNLNENQKKNLQMFCARPKI